jgi:hypothetical protein
MVVSEQSCGGTNQMTGLVDMLLQPVGLARAWCWWQATGLSLGSRAAYSRRAQKRMRRG